MHLAYNATDFISFELLFRSNVLIYLDVMYKYLERYKVRLHFMYWNFISADISYHDLVLQHRIASHCKLQEMFITYD